MVAIEVNHLVKKYPSFTLDDISFHVNKGEITGFIGRNGAGKTTTIKSMLNLIHPDSGDVFYYNQSLIHHEKDIKEKIGYSTGSIQWYPRKKIKDIVKIVKGFYDTWDDELYHRYLSLFQIDESKTPRELSEGMKVKLNIVLALSHRIDVLILDEPTSGLDPFSRNEVLEIFKELKKQGVAIFFSTHIISDIEKCADSLVYIQNGKIVTEGSIQTFMEKYANTAESLEDCMLRLEGGNFHV